MGGGGGRFVTPIIYFLNKIHQNQIEKCCIARYYIFLY
jgi:hypothetical protein